MNPAPARSIVVVAGDPGPAAALSPVIGRLRERGGSPLAVLAYGQALALWRGQGFAPRALADDGWPESADRLLGDMDAGLVVCGASVNRLNLEQHFIDAARRRGVPSLSLLDFPTNYRARYQDAEGRLAHLPDRIAVGDADCAREMAQIGFPAERLRVVGWTGLDALAGFREKWTPEARQTLRQGLGLAANDLLVLFVSQPLRELYEHPSLRGRGPGYDEHQVLALLLAGLEGLAPDLARQGRRLHLLVRTHPRERADKFREVRGRDVRLIPSPGGQALAEAAAADLVVGMNSMLLLQACHLGQLVLSLQPGLQGPDCLHTNRRGQSLAVYDAAQVPDSLARALLDPDFRARTLAKLTDLIPDGQAGRRLADLAWAMYNGAESSLTQEDQA